MARNETTLAKSLYFCSVKSHMRHVVAGKSSVFRASKFEVKLYPDECGRSNAHKGSAYDTLTARIGILYCHKIMQNNSKLQDAQLKTIESIQEFLTDFHSVSEMYERTALALAELMFYSKLMSPEAQEKINDMVQDHICLLNRLTTLNEKGGEV